MLYVWVNGCDPGRISDGSRLASCQTFSIDCPSSIIFWHVYFVIVPFFLSFLFYFMFVFLFLSLKLCRCSSHRFLSSRSRTGLAITYITEDGLRPDRVM